MTHIFIYFPFCRNVFPTHIEDSQAVTFHPRKPKHHGVAPSVRQLVSTISLPWLLNPLLACNRIPEVSAGSPNSKGLSSGSTFRKALTGAVDCAHACVLSSFLACGHQPSASWHSDLCCCPRLSFAKDTSFPRFYSHRTSWHSHPKG